MALRVLSMAFLSLAVGWLIAALMFQPLETYDGWTTLVLLATSWSFGVADLHQRR